MRGVSRSHPQAGGPVLTTLRAAGLLLRSKIVTLRAAGLFLMQCKAEYKTHARFGVRSHDFLLSIPDIGYGVAHTN